MSLFFCLVFFSVPQSAFSKPHTSKHLLSKAKSPSHRSSSSQRNHASKNSYPRQKQTSLFKELKLGSGDRIRSVDGQSVRSKEQAYRLLRKALKKREPFSVSLVRNGKRIRVFYRLSSGKVKNRFVISKISASKRKTVALANSRKAKREEGRSRRNLASLKRKESAKPVSKTAAKADRKAEKPASESALKAVGKPAKLASKTAGKAGRKVEKSASKSALKAVGKPAKLASKTAGKAGRKAEKSASKSALKAVGKPAKPASKSVGKAGRKVEKSASKPAVKANSKLAKSAAKPTVKAGKAMKPLVPEKYKRYLQRAYVGALNSFIYEKPDFDAKPLYPLPPGKKFLSPERFFAPLITLDLFIKFFFLTLKKLSALFPKRRPFRSL